MRPALLLPALALCGTAWAQAPESAGDAESARAALAAKLVRRAAEEYTIRPASGPGGKSAPLTLRAEPILKWSNPVAGSIHGAIFVWTADGRPQAIGSIYKYFEPARHLGVEFNSLAPGPLTAEREGREVWHPARAGVDWKPIPDAPAPAEAAAGRLRQMRALAEPFAAEETDEKGVTRDLRLLTQPIYRYPGGPGQPDGGIFAFVQGTDPEIFLLIEARPTDAGRPEWRYALARATYMKLKSTHRGRAIWDAPLVRWDDPGSALYDRAEPFTVFVFKPGEGVNPPRASPEK